MTDAMDDLDKASQAGIAPWTDLVSELTDFHVAVFRDRYPVTRGHLLFVPRYRTQSTIQDCFDSAMRHGHLMVQRGECDGFNVGMNNGISAGQTVMYPHVHLIPRRVGDCDDPVGGIRAVVAGQANYKKETYREP
jgi:diadenosine tetraphosphate (Ap4A) HIT family hydrolase